MGHNVQIVKHKPYKGEKRATSVIVRIKSRKTGKPITLARTFVQYAE